MRNLDYNRGVRISMLNLYNTLREKITLIIRYVIAQPPLLR